MIVTIDGPAGTGKSTVARRLADVLGYEYLDTGAMYRMIALKAILHQIDPSDHQTVSELAARTQLNFVSGGCWMDGADVTASLRTPEVTLAASLVAQVPAVRETLVRRQREVADALNIVCEGRDQGTVAFPHAECKFFLTAQPEERARRRMKELQAQGKTVDFEELLRDQMARDQRDQARSISPLKAAPDAFVVDTTNLTIDQVVDLLQTRIRQRPASSS